MGPLGFREGAAAFTRSRANAAAPSLNFPGEAREPRRRRGPGGPCGIGSEPGPATLALRDLGASARSPEKHF